jgi:hypothetical protein
MENSYELTFIDLDYFEYLSQFTKDTFNVYDEIKKLRKPYLKEKKLKDAIPEYKNYPVSKDFTGDEIGKLLQIPKSSTELLRYISECDGRVYYLFQIDKFLDKYSSFQDTFLNACLIDIREKELLSKDDKFINESFTSTKKLLLKSKRVLKPEHYYCRLRNNYYSIHPEELFNDYGQFDSKISFEFGLIMFYEFANYLLLFKYLEENYTRDDRTLPVKYSNLYHFLKYNQNMRGTQLQYIEFIKRNRHVNMSKVQPTTFKYDDFIQPLFHDLCILYNIKKSK